MVTIDAIRKRLDMMQQFRDDPSYGHVSAAIYADDVAFLLSLLERAQPWLPQIEAQELPTDPKYMPNQPMLSTVPWKDFTE